MIDVMLHSIDMIENEGEQIDALTLLQPTSPLRREAHNELHQSV